ncbi:MAG: zinc-dependent alcohol dehydrogenase [Planctomycetota bacterium]
MQMKAAFKQGRTVTVRDHTLPPITPDQVRLRVETCGVCGTDLHDRPGEEETESGFGHEMAGTVLEVGARVSTVAPGDRVAVESASACGFCTPCRNTEQELCADLKSFFINGEFGFQEESVVPFENAIPYDGMSADVASLSEPLAVAVDLVRVADIRPRQNVILMGPGPIGLMAIPLLKQAGAGRIYVWGRTRRTARIELAKQFGADEILDADAVDLATHDFGHRIDRILVTSPPRTLPAAFAAASKGGRVAFIGIEHGAGAQMTFDVNAFHFKKLRLVASFASPALQTPLALELLRDRTVDGEALISHRYPLDRLAEAMETARSAPDAIKVVVNP